MSAKRITVFSIGGCSHCRLAKALLSRLQLSSPPYVEIDVERFPHRYTKAAEATGVSTVPLIFVGHVFIGGNTELHDAEAAGKLKELMSGDSWAMPPWLDEFTAEELCQAKRDEQTHASQFPEPKVDLPNGFSVGYSELLRMLKETSESGLSIADRGLFWCKKQTFVGADLVKAVRRLPLGVSDDREAVRVCQSLMDVRMFHDYEQERNAKFSPSPAALYRFQVDAGSPSLNKQRIFLGTPRDPNVVASELRRRLEQVLNNYADADGVDYPAIASSSEFAAYVDASSELQTVDLSQLDRNSRIAFGLNVYNMCILHGYAALGSPEGWIAKWKFFNNVGYDIGGHHYSLNDIENGLLRGNRKGLGSFSVPFASSDVRLSTIVNPVDYRIHFGLNCGAKSCPPIKVYSPGELDKQLDLAGAAFLSGSTFDASSKRLTVSKIVSWYAEDFGVDPVATLLPHLPSHVADVIRSCGGTHGVSLDFFEYDWSTNAKKS